MRVAPELGIGFDGGLVEEGEEEEEEMMLMLMLPPPLVGEVWAEGEEDDDEEEEEKDVLERWWATCLACERGMRLLELCCNRIGRGFASFSPLGQARIFREGYSRSRSGIASCSSPRRSAPRCSWRRPSGRCR